MTPQERVETVRRMGRFGSVPMGDVTDIDAETYLRREAKKWTPFVSALQSGEETDDYYFLSEFGSELEQAVRLAWRDHLPRSRILDVFTDVFYNDARMGIGPEEASDMAILGLNKLREIALNLPRN